MADDRALDADTAASTETPAAQADSLSKSNKNEQQNHNQRGGRGRGRGRGHGGGGIFGGRAGASSSADGNGNVAIHNVDRSAGKGGGGNGKKAAKSKSGAGKGAEPVASPEASAEPFVDTHFHIEYILQKTRDASWSAFLDKNPIPSNCEAMLSVYCDPGSMSPSFGAWRDHFETDERVYGAFGIHPHNAKYYTSQVEERIVEILESHERAIAWGECGLDFHYNNSPQDIQREVFARQLKRAVQLNLPIVIHSRDAEDDTIDILKSCVPSDWKMHMHCFGESPEHAMRLQREFSNCFIGFTGAVTFRNAEQTRRAAEAVPLNRILFETDGPYMAPCDSSGNGRGKVATPKHIPIIADAIAQAKSCSVVELMRAVRQNTRDMEQSSTVVLRYTSAFSAKKVRIVLETRSGAPPRHQNYVRAGRKVPHRLLGLHSGSRVFQSQLSPVFVPASTQWHNATTQGATLLQLFCATVTWNMKAKWPLFRKKWFIVTCVSAASVLLLTGIILATVYILKEEEESAEDELFEKTILPLVEQSLTEIEVHFEEGADLQASIARTISATSTLLAGFRQRVAIGNVVELSGSGFERERNPALFVSWNPIETSETIDEAVSFKQMNGFPDFQIRPPGNRSIYVPVFDIAPPSEENAAVLGFDLWTSVARRSAIISARDSGMTTMSEPLDLVTGIRGIAIYTAVFPIDLASDDVQFDAPSTLVLRRELVAGFLCTAMDVRGLFQRTLAQAPAFGEDEVDVCLFDKVQTGQPSIDEDPRAPGVTNLVGCWPDSPLNTLNGTRRIEDPKFDALTETRWTAVRMVDALGRQWVALISGKNLDPNHEVPAAAIIAIILMSVLVLVLLIGGFFYASALKRTIASARAARKAAEDTARAKSDFLAHVSHELRTPLNGVVGMIEVALADPDIPRRAGNNLQLARDSATVLLEVINDVLDFTKAETGNMHVESIAFPVESLLVSTVRMHVLQAQSKGIRLFLRLDRAVPEVAISDPFRIRQILMNLLNNAVKFTDVGFVRVVCDLAPPDEEVVAATPIFRPWTDSMEILQESASRLWSDEQVLTDSMTDEEGFVADRSHAEEESILTQPAGMNLSLRVRVIDTGIGFAPEDGVRLFSPFVQAGTSTTRLYGGTGLGLPISSKLALLLGGRLTCSSRGPSQGSCFELEVPIIVGSTADLKGTLASESSSSSGLVAGPPSSTVGSSVLRQQVRAARADATAESGETTESLQSEQDADSKVKVLLVDDNIINLKVFSMMLRDIGIVETAENGQAAVDLCVEKTQQRGWPPYDIVLIDMSMPIMNGADATKEIRHLEEMHSTAGRKRLPVLLVSASQVPVDEELFDGALWKPVRRQALRDAVVDYTHGQQGATAAATETAHT